MIRWRWPRLRLGAAASGSTASVGRKGERLASRHLKKQGFKLLAKNLKVAGGEIDLLMLAPDRETIAVIEVKSRIASDATASQHRPEANITHNKRAQLRKLTTALRKSRGWQERKIRIDVVAVEMWEHKPPVIRHYVAAV